MSTEASKKRIEFVVSNTDPEVSIVINSKDQTKAAQMMRKLVKCLIGEVGITNANAERPSA